MRWPAWWPRWLLEEKEQNAMVSTIEMATSDVSPNANGSVSSPAERMELMTITPAMAAAWLETLNGTNRPLSEAVARKYSRDILACNWLLSNDAITFNMNGMLINGQHRLRAVVLADEPIRAFVIRGLSDDTFRVIDSGKARTMADALAVDGELNASVLGAAIRVVWHYEQDTLFVQEGAAISPTHAELAATFARHPGIRDSIVRGRAVHKFMGPGPATALHYLFSQKDAAAADRFFDRLADGDGLVKGDPVFALRERLQENRASNTKMTRPKIMQLVVKAWNAVRAGQRVNYFKLFDGIEAHLKIR